MKKLFTLLFALMACITFANANTIIRVQIGDLYYHLYPENNTAEVTYKSHLGIYNQGWDITTANIPSFVTYKDVNYSVTVIGSSAFSGCTALTSVEIPNSVTSIGSHAFSGCIALKEPVYNAHVFAYLPTSYFGAYVIPKDIKKIAGGAFSDCVGLTSVTIPNSVTSIGEYAFHHCTGLTSVQIPNSITRIESYSFQSSGLTSVTIPSSVKTIGGYAFSYCTGLASVTIPNSVTGIETYAFDGCTGLTSVHINDVAKWCEILFVDGRANPLYYAHHLYLNNTEIKDLVIPNTVTSIGKNAFLECSGLTSVNIPKGVTSIGNHAFSFCTGITSVNIPNSVTSIGNSAFDNCVALASVNIPNSVTSIGNYAFNGCISLTSFVIPNAVTSFGDGVIMGCSGLTSVKIPDYFTNISPSTFAGCTGLTSIEIPNTITSIGNSAFANCTGLTSITLPNNITTITENVFKNCSGLTSVKIPNTVTRINSHAFDGCIGLTSITLPSSVSIMGGYVFNKCTGLTSFTCEAMVPPTFSGLYILGDFDKSIPLYVPSKSVSLYQTAEVWNIFRNILPIPCILGSGTCGENLTWELICDSILTISGMGTMADYTGSDPAPWYSYRNYIKYVVIDNGVTSIGDFAFSNCTEIISVEIPDGVTRIGSSAFANCTGLGTITCEAVAVPALGENVFSNVPKSIPLNVPEKSIDLYRTANQWKDFTNMSPIECILGSGTCDENLTWELNCDGVLVISGKGAMKNYSSFSSYPWYSKKSYIKTIIIGNEVTSIGNKAFYGCTGLTSLTIGSSVTSIGNETFFDCRGLKSVTIPNSVTSIGNQAFYECTGLKALIIGNSVANIGYSAFEYCGNLTTIEIPNNVASIGEMAFYGCSRLSYIFVDPENPNYSDIDGVLFNKNQTEILLYPIGHSTQNYTIPNTVTSIAEYAFDGCTGLTSLTIPNSVTSITEGMGFACTGLASITVDPENPNYSDIDGVLFNKDQTELIQYPIGKQAQSYTIPNTVTSIGGYAFANCTLTAITCEAVTPPTCGTDVFQDVSRTIPIYVLANSVSTYKSTSPWSEWGDNIKPIAAEETAVAEPKVQPTENSVVIEWPKANEAAVYTILIKKGDELICTLSFNALGQLLNISFAAPARNGNSRQTPAAKQTSTGWQYTISGLEPGTDYSYTVIAKKSDESVVYNETVPFKTEQIATALDQINNDKCQMTNKILRDGQILILRGEKVYTVTGQEVK